MKQKNKKMEMVLTKETIIGANDDPWVKFAKENGWNVIRLEERK